MADFGHKQQAGVEVVDGRDVSWPDFQLVFRDDGRTVGIVEMTADLEEIDFGEDFPEHDVVQLKARGGSRRNFVGQQDGDGRFVAGSGDCSFGRERSVSVRIELANKRIKNDRNRIQMKYIRSYIRSKKA